MQKLHKELLKTAKYLALDATPTRPRQTDLRRAVSTAYYAMFHALAENNANLLINETRRRGQASAKRAWRQTYRALEHRLALNACKKCIENGTLGFPDKIQSFARSSVTLQAHRHEADYDPFAIYTRTEVLQHIDMAEQAISGLTGSRATLDKQAFAAFILFKSR